MDGGEEEKGEEVRDKKLKGIIREQDDSNWGKGEKENEKKEEEQHGKEGAKRKKKTTRNRRMNTREKINKW